MNSLSRPPLTLAVLISGNGSNLHAIIRAIALGTLHARIAIVISSRADAPGLSYATQANIATCVIDAKDYPSRNDYDRALHACLTQYPLQLIVLAGFMRILGPQLVSTYYGKIINIHPSLLPKHPGLHTHAKVLAAHDNEHGLTIHFVNSELDAGPIIGQAKLAICVEDTETSLAHRVQQLEHIYYPQVIQWFSEQRIQLAQEKITLDGKRLGSNGYLLCNTDNPSCH